MKQGSGTQGCVCIYWVVDYNLKGRWLGKSSLNTLYPRSPARGKGEALGSSGRRASQARVQKARGSWVGSIVECKRRMEREVCVCNCCTHSTPTPRLKEWFGGSRLCDSIAPSASLFYFSFLSTLTLPRSQNDGLQCHYPLTLEEQSVFLTLRGLS